MKDKIVDTALGRMLLEVSRFVSLHSISFKNPESASAVANAIIADRLIQRLCKPGATFIDVGAHIGSIFSSVHSYDKSIEIIAFEADPTKAESLRNRYDYCRLIETAVGESEGEADFFISKSATGYNSLDPGSVGDHTKITVRVAKIDDLLPTENPDLIKMDIEGAELGALRGAKNLIQRSKPTIMFESMGVEENSLGYSPALLWEWFNSMGYLIVSPDTLAHTAPALELETFLYNHHYPFQTYNYFAVHRDRRIEIRDKARSILGVKESG